MKEEVKPIENVPDEMETIVSETIEQIDEVINNLSDDNPNTPFGIIDETDDDGSEE